MEWAQMVNLADIEVNVAITNMFKELKENMMTITQFGHRNKNIKIIKNNQWKILELKSTITKVKNSSRDGLPRPPLHPHVHTMHNKHREVINVFINDSNEKELMSWASKDRVCILMRD